MNMDRRSFLKGMLAISTGVVVGPLLPLAGVAEAQGALIVKDEETAIAVVKAMGRLGRVRIDRAWFPLEDAQFMMFRRFAPLMSKDDRVMRPDPLVNSPWQVQIWTPEMEIHDFFDDRRELEFEFDTRQASFIGNGYLTEMESSMYNPRRADEAGALFSITLEGDSKLRRFGEVRMDRDFF